MCVSVRESQNDARKNDFTSSYIHSSLSLSYSFSLSYSYTLSFNVSQALGSHWKECRRGTEIFMGFRTGPPGN